MLLETTILDIVTYVVIVFQVLVCILLILVVMMQRPKQEGLGAAFGGDTMDSLTGAHATDFLQKGTAMLGTLLFVLTFVISMLVIAGASNDNKSSANESDPAPVVEIPAATGEEAGPVIPANPDDLGEDPNLPATGTEGDTTATPETVPPVEGSTTPAGDKPATETTPTPTEDKPATETTPTPTEDKPATGTTPTPTEDKPATSTTPAVQPQPVAPTETPANK